MLKPKIYPYISQENGFWYLNLTTSLDANNEWDFEIEYPLNTAREVRLPNIENFLATFIHLSATYTTSEIWVKATNIWVITSELCDITFRVRFFYLKTKDIIKQSESNHCPDLLYKGHRHQHRFPNKLTGRHYIRFLPFAILPVLNQSNKNGKARQC